MGVWGCLLSQYLTLQEVTQLLGVSPRTIRRYVNKGLLTRWHNKGRCIFIEHEVKSLAESKSKKGALGVIYDRVGALNAKMISLDIRVRVLELALSSRQPDAELKPDDVKVVKAEIRRVSKKGAIPYDTLCAWSEDLLRLDRAACSRLGFKLLKTFTSRLITKGEAMPEILSDPSRLIILDKLSLFSTRLQGYASTTSASAERSRQASVL